MANSFEKLLLMKTAEQLSNMSRNSSQWSKEQNSLIRKEIEKRGLVTFEEPEDWNEQEMNSLDLDNPQTDFEKDMSFLVSHKVKDDKEVPFILAAKIVSVFAVVFPVVILSFQLNSLTVILAAIVGITSFVLLALKQYLPSIIVGCLSILIALPGMVSLLTSIFGI